MITTALLLTAGAVFIADQLSKSLALRGDTGAVRSTAPQRLPRIRVVSNGIGFGIVRHRHRALVLWVLAVASIVVAIELGRVFESVAAQIGIGAAIGGATGNLMDSFFRRRIIDFIDLRFWPVFNLADCAIVGGLGLILWASL